MFSILPYRYSLDFLIPQFRESVIHFGANHKDMYALEAEWVKKFESLLSKLCWYDAEVFTSWGFKYEWDAIALNYFEQYDHNPPVPPKNWTLKCYKLEEKALSTQEAIEGSYVSEYWQEK
jgi:hypothetical protein